LNLSDKKCCINHLVPVSVLLPHLFPTQSIAKNNTGIGTSQNVESKKPALNPFGKACFFVISCIIPAYPVEQEEIFS
jgi:hypothetical protein